MKTSGILRYSAWLFVAGILGVIQLQAGPIPGLFNTGLNASGALLPAGAADPHWTLFQSADPAVPGPNAYVVNDAWPVQSGVWMLNGPSSKWIAPVADQGNYGYAGNFTYRITFDLTGLEPSSAVITGTWTSDNTGPDLRLNGVSTGFAGDGNFGNLGNPFTLDSGFVEGVNTLDFVVNNAAGGGSNPTGFRAELSGTADLEAPPGTAPSILESPESASVGLGAPITFSVQVYGSRPFAYQWRLDGNPIPNGTNASHIIPSVSFANAGAYDVIVSNEFGAASSAAATLEVTLLSPAQNSYEPLGPSSRRTGLVFSEIMYHPADRTDGRNLEFVEIYNTNPFYEDLSGYRLSGEVDYTFPDGTRIEGLGWLVIAPAPQDLTAVYGLANVLGGFTNRMNNAGGMLRLRKRSGGIVLELTYNDQHRWPVAADGTGHSMILARPSYGEGNPYAWEASALVGGSPGAPDPIPTGLLENIVINEIVAHTDLPLLDFVEIYNHSPLPVDVSGCWLSDNRDTNKFQIPQGTVLPPNGFADFDESELGFRLDANGETLYLVRPDQQRALDVLRFGGQANGISFGRFPDGASGFQELAARTPGEVNAPLLVRDIVINEIMYHPISENDDDEFVELYNQGAAAVDLSGWQFMDGIDYAFPPGTSISAGGYLVVARNAARLLTNYPGLNSALVKGDYGGVLANGGERIALGMPDYVFVTNAIDGAITTNAFFVVVDEVTYVDGGQWGQWSDGGGSSLELIDPRSDNRLPSNWVDSDETSKAPWTLVEHTGVLDLGTGTPSAQLQIHLQGPGEALVDDVEVMASSGGNRIANPGFESGTSGWVFTGTHRRTSLETGEGYDSAQSMRVRASDRGDTVNYIRTTFTSTFQPSLTATIKAQVRWLRGQPEILFRMKENYLEAVGRLNVPANLGTPGAPNSGALANAAPAITEVTHRPALPAANQPIRVTARVHDSEGIGSVAVRYRIDPDSLLETMPMMDDGTGGDLVAGDGIYAGIIPGQPSSTLIAFRVEATDGAVTPASSQFPSDAPERECLIRVGEYVPEGSFGSYRIWITQATFDLWSSREKMSNEALDATFVYGNHRVIYNAGSYFAGSAWSSPGYTTPTGVLSGYDVLYPDDQPFLGDNHVILDWPNRDSTYQREHTMYWLLEQLGLPNLYRRNIHLFVNGARRGTLYNDAQQPGGDILSEWFPNDDQGSLFKTGYYFEFSDSGAREGGEQNWLQNYTTTGGVKKTARYRWNWKPRSIRGTANDFAPLFDLVDAVNLQGESYIPAVASQVDIEQWMRTFAMNDLASYWDAFGNENDKNTYLYKPLGEGWKLISWDFDVGLGAGIGNGLEVVNAALFPSDVDPAIKQMYATPVFVRAYWRALDEAVNSFFQATAVNEMLTAKYQAFQDNGVSVTSPFVASGVLGISITDFITQRRAYLLTQLATVAANFAVDGPSEFAVDTNLLALTGSAPVSVHTITINGAPYPVTWTSVTGWSLQVVLASGLNTLTVEGLDRLGQPVAGASAALSVTFTGGEVSPVDIVVINEIMYNPLAPQASFLELFNASATHAFDLSGWRLNGVDLTFPNGSLIGPGQYLVLAKDAKTFGVTYGGAVPVYAPFNGTLANDGETLTLFMPGAEPGEEIIVDRVTYDDQPPWPAAANGQGPSLQLIDPLQDNNRVSNWSDGQGWRFFSYTGSVGSNPGSQFSILFEQAGGDIFLDDMAFVEGDVPYEGQNLLANGGFEDGLNGWGVGRQATNSALITDDVHSGNASLHLIMDPGARLLTSFYQTIAGITPSVNHTLSFWYKPGATGSLFEARLNSFFWPKMPVDAILATPAAPNAGTGTLPPYPLLWLSEVQPNNESTLTDNQGEADPWIEIHNSGSQAMLLDEVFLSDELGNLAAWPFPAGVQIESGEYRVIWADGQPEQAGELHWHTSFRLNPTNGSVYLSRLNGGTPQILDYFHYGSVETNQSYGAYPPAQTSYRDTFYYPTPGASNSAALPLVPLFINEWLASNSGRALDPADQDADDWFEIYNPNSSPVDFSGYWLSDRADRPSKFVVPPGFEVPAQGFLLVWADEETGQNLPPDQLHVNFKLGAGGEQILLSAPNGQLVDSINFGPQTNNISEGRYSDGAAAPFYFMPVPTPRAPNQIPTPTAPEPVIESILVDMDLGTTTLTWAATDSATYRVQFKDDLDSEWQDLPGDITAVGLSSSKTDTSISGVDQRFYRVMRLETP